MKVLDIFSLAFHTIRSNKLRTGITVAIIAFGIMALIGIITAIQAMSQKLSDSFSTMGANGFTIRTKERNFRVGRRTLELSKKQTRKEKTSNLNQAITEEDAEEFVHSFQFPATVSISSFAGNRNTISFGAEKTNPNVFLFGGDENYLELNGFSLASGRNFSVEELQTSANVCLLGFDIAKKLFRQKTPSALNKIVQIEGRNYRVVGVLASRGSTFGFSRDNLSVIGYRNMQKTFGQTTYVIGIKTPDIHQVENAMGEAEGKFRAIRQLDPTEENNFVLERSDSLAERAIRSLNFLTISVTIVGLITLIGAAIGLMNIMLVAVAERTKEVGLVKAIGGKGKNIRQQFLLEAVLISIMGAVLGILLGVLVGNLFAMLLQTGFVVPWQWVIYGIIICTLVGLAAGMYPAYKAGKLNPIEALRYE